MILFKIFQKRTKTLDEFDKRFKFILDHKIDTSDNYYKTKRYYFLHLQASSRDNL